MASQLCFDTAQKNTWGAAFLALKIYNLLISNKLAEREGIEPTKDRLPFNGFENRGDHQARSTLR